MSGANFAGQRKGFALIEALVSVTLLATGIAATVAGMGAISRAEYRSQEREQMQRLAFRKYDELIGTQALQAGQTSGDFEEMGEPRFIWSAARSSTGNGNLDLVRVDVARAYEGFSHAVTITGLVCKPSASANGKGTP